IHGLCGRLFCERKLGICGGGDRTGAGPSDLVLGPLRVVWNVGLDPCRYQRRHRGSDRSAVAEGVALSFERDILVDKYSGGQRRKVRCRVLRRKIEGENLSTRHRSPTTGKAIPRFICKWYLVGDVTQSAPLRSRRRWLVGVLPLQRTRGLTP